MHYFTAFLITLTQIKEYKKEREDYKNFKVLFNKEIALVFNSMNAQAHLPTTRYALNELH